MTAPSRRDRAAEHDHRGQRHHHDHDRADGGLRQPLVGGEAVDADRQRIEIERPDQQRRRQLLHHLDEGHDGRRQHRPAQQRQMDAPQHLARPGTQHARAGVHRRIDGGKAGRDVGEPDREEAHRVGKQQRERRAAQQEPARQSKDGAAQPVDAVIGQRQRQQDADGDHGARDGVAQGGELDQPVERAAAHQAAGIAQEQGEHDDDRGGRRGEAEAVGGVAQEMRVDGDRARPPRELRQMDRRHDEAQDDGQRTGRDRADRRPERKLGRIALVAQVRGDVEAGAAARMALDQDQEAGDGDQDERDLRGALAIAEPVPGPIDRRRQRLHAVILDGAEIGERLEERQHHAGGDGGPRQRQARRRRRCATGRGPGCGSPRSGRATG